MKPEEEVVEAKILVYTANHLRTNSGKPSDFFCFSSSICNLLFEVSNCMTTVGLWGVFDLKY